MKSLCASTSNLVGSLLQTESKGAFEKFLDDGANGYAMGSRMSVWDFCASRWRCVAGKVGKVESCII